MVHRHYRHNRQAASASRDGPESAFASDRSATCGDVAARFALGLLLAASLSLHAGAQVAGTQAHTPNIAAPSPGFPASAVKPPAPLPIEEAVLKAAGDLFRQVSGRGQPIEIVIDRLIDGITGIETVATRSIGRQLFEIAAVGYPDIKVLPFTPDNLARARFVFIGTFNAINNAGQAAGPRDAFWICFALVDTQEKVVTARAVGRAEPAGIDSTPVPLFATSPVWALDSATLAYIRTCQRSRPGDAVEPAYIDRLEIRAALVKAHAAFDSGRLHDAMTEFQRIADSPGGDEVIDALNGLYLTLMNAGRTKEAMAAFGRLIDAGLRQQRLGVIFLFEPRSAAFARDPAISGVYPAWLERIAHRMRAASVCLRVIGHSSRTGPEGRNVRLTRARAMAVRDRLLRTAPELAARLTAAGAGSSEVLVGLPVDDLQTMLDRRVEFHPDGCGKRLNATRRTAAVAGPRVVGAAFLRNPAGEVPHAQFPGIQGRRGRSGSPRLA